MSRTARIALVVALSALAVLITVTVLAYVNAPEPRPAIPAEVNPAVSVAPAPTFGQLDPVGQDTYVRESAEAAEDYRQKANRPSGIEPESHAGTRDEAPSKPGLQERSKDDPLLRQQDRDGERTTTGSDDLRVNPVQATPSQPGCVTRFVRNSSARSIRPSHSQEHFTVSREVPGWSDIWALTAYANNPRSQASWHYIIDREGHCAYNVPESRKAWTAGGMNGSNACSIEFIGDGRREKNFSPAQIRVGGRVFRDCHRRWGIPLQRATFTSRGGTIRAGHSDHDRLPLNDHTDTNPWSEEQMLASMKQGGVPPVPAKVETWCRRLTLARTAKDGLATTERRSAARERKALIQKAGYTCTSAGPAKR